MEVHPEMKRPLYHVPHHKGVIGAAANFVLHLSERMNRSRDRQGAVN